MTESPVVGKDLTESRIEDSRFYHYQRQTGTQKGGTIFQSLVWYKSADDISLVVPDNGTFSECFKSLEQALKRQQPPALQICVVAAKSKWLRGPIWFMSFGSDSLQLIPMIQYIVGGILARCWQIKDEELLDECLSEIEFTPPIWSPRWPSKRIKSTPCGNTGRTHEDVMDVLERMIKLEWYRDAPKYISNFSVYVRQLFAAMPEAKYAKVLLLPASQSDDRRALVTLKTEGMVARLREQFWTAQTPPDHPSARKMDWVMRNHVLQLIEHLFDDIRTDGAVSLQETSEEINYLVCSTSQSSWVYGIFGYETSF